jgi:uncharacterized cupredoxin-like copper-binding protein
MPETVGMNTPETPSLTTSRRIALAAALLAALVLAACGSGTPATSATPLAPSGDVIELTLTGSLQIVHDGQKVDLIQVQQGKTYTFRITNSAGFAHDFHVGTDADLVAGRAGLPGLEQYSNGTQEFSYTFSDAGPLMFGCTVPGHYNTMKGRFDIQP